MATSSRLADRTAIAATTATPTTPVAAERVGDERNGSGSVAGRQPSGPRASGQQKRGRRRRPSRFARHFFSNGANSAAATRSPRDASPHDDDIAYPDVSAYTSKLMNFRVELDLFRGPLDLLLYLVRKHELDVTQLPLAKIADQFEQTLEVLVELDFDAVGEFLEMASTLIELKSRYVLPHAPEEEDEIEDQREELVQRLLEYKQYKDAAGLLQARGQEWQQCYARLGHDLPVRRVEASDQPIQEVEVWDLVSAFGRIMRDSQLAAAPPTIIYDDTPIHVHMRHIHGRLVAEERVLFSSIFRLGMHKSALIGLFLAVLELVRHYDVAVEQTGLHSEIWIVRGEDFRPGFEVMEDLSIFDSEAAGQTSAEVVSD